MRSVIEENEKGNGKIDISEIFSSSVLGLHKIHITFKLYLKTETICSVWRSSSRQLCGFEACLSAGPSSKRSKLPSQEAIRFQKRTH